MFSASGVFVGHSFRFSCFANEIHLLLSNLLIWFANMMRPYLCAASQT